MPSLKADISSSGCLFSSAEMKLFRGTTSLALLATICLASSQDNDLNYAIGLVNQARQAQGLRPLSWDPDLAAYAQFWANEMASGRQPFAHATGQYRPYQGENLYQRASGQCDGAYEYPVQTAMRAWLAQQSLYSGQPITTGREPWLHWCTACSAPVETAASSLLTHNSSVYVVDNHPHRLRESLRYLGGVQGL